MDWLDDSHAGCGWKHVHSHFILQIFRQNSLEWITEDLSRCLWCCSLSWLTGHCRADGSTPLPPPVVRNSGGMWHDLHHYCCLLLCVFVDRCLTRQWSVIREWRVTSAWHHMTWRTCRETRTEMCSSTDLRREEEQNNAGVHQRGISSPQCDGEGK